MTVFFNFFEKSATKHQLSYRYGARTENLTFFENRSLNQGFHSLYGVKVEKVFKNTPQIRYYWTVLCERRKSNFFVKYYTNGSLLDSVMQKEEKLSLICIQKHGLCRVLVQERKNIFYLLNCIQIGISS